MSDNDFSPAYVHADNDVGRIPARIPAPEGMFDCEPPCINGVYYGRGRVENGKFVGFTGKCYRCGGKGYQTPADVKRNTYYDNHVRRYSV